MKKLLFVSGGTLLLLLSVLFGAFETGPLLASAQSTINVATSPIATSPVGTGTQTSTINPSCQRYLKNLAQHLNIPVTSLEEADGTVRKDALAQLVKDGKLTQAESTLLEQRIATHQICNTKGKNQQGQGILRSMLQKYQGTLLSQIAQSLHLTVSQLQSDLQHGRTLNAIAKTQGVAQSQLPTLFLGAVQNTLNQAQKAGDITQQQSDELMQYLQQRPHLIKRWLNNPFTNK